MEKLTKWATLMLLIFSLSLIYSCKETENPGLPNPCSSIKPPNISIVYPSGNVYHPSVFLEIITKCEDCDAIQVLDGETVIKEVPNGFNSFYTEQDITRIFVKRNSNSLRLRAVKGGCYFDKGREGNMLNLDYHLGFPANRFYIGGAKSRNWSVFVKRGQWHQSIQEAIQWWNKPEWGEGVVHLRRGGGHGFPIHIYIYEKLNKCPDNEPIEEGGCVYLKDRCVILVEKDHLNPQFMIHLLGHCIMVPDGHSLDPSSFMSLAGSSGVYFPPEEKYWFKIRSQ